MANRRMCSLKIIDTDKFLDMPNSTQALYFHLVMRADDDGFVSAPKKITKFVNCGDDDLKLLIAKGYLMPFDSGVCVVTHWRIHNYIQKDRYQPTIYVEEYKQLCVTEDTVYALATNCIQNGIEMDTQVRLNKNRINQDRDNIDNITAPKGATTQKETRHKYGSYGNVLLSDEELEKLKTEFPNDWNERVERLSVYIASTGKKYKDYLATIRSWAKNDKTVVNGVSKNQQPDYSDVSRYENLKWE